MAKRIRAIITLLLLFWSVTIKGVLQKNGQWIFRCRSVLKLRPQLLHKQTRHAPPNTGHYVFNLTEHVLQLQRGVGGNSIKSTSQYRNRDHISYCTLQDMLSWKKGPHSGCWGTYPVPVSTKSIPRINPKEEGKSVLSFVRSIPAHRRTEYLQEKR